VFKQSIALFFLIFFVSFSLALDGPTISSPSHPDSDSWYKESRPTLEWNKIEGATLHSYVLDRTEDTVPDEESEGTEISYRSQSKTDGEWYFHIRSKVSGQWSDTSHFKLNIDHTAPLPPKNLGVEVLEEGGLQITWDPAEDVDSGVSTYQLFRAFERDFDIRDPNTISISNTLTSTNYVEEDLLEGRTYHYRVRGIDIAGNFGRITKSVFARTLSFCDLEINFITSIENNVLSIEVTSSGGEMRKAHLEVTAPNQDPVELIKRVSYTESISREFDLNGVSEGNILFDFDVEDKGEDTCDVDHTFIYDTVDPDGDWLFPSENNKLEEVVELKVKAFDLGSNLSGIKNVELFYEKDEITKIGDASNSSGDQFVFDWNTTTIPNGRYTLIAKIKDQGDNIVEIKVSVVLENSGYLSTLLQAAINKIQDEKTEADKIRNFLLEKGIESESFSDLIAAADGNFFRAEDLARRGLFLEQGFEHVENAKNLYKQASELISFERYNTLYNIFELGAESSLYREAGLKSEFIDEASSMLVELGVVRRIEFFKTTGLGQPIYSATVVLVFNDTNISTPVQIVESVPKAFAENADQLVSSNPFEVYKADPIIKFNIDLAEGNRITYSLKKEFSKAEVDEFINTKVNEAFLAPPIVLSASTTIGADVIQEKIDVGKSISEFFSSEDSTFLILGGVLLILFLFFVIAVIAIAIVIFVLAKRKKTGL